MQITLESILFRTCNFGVVVVGDFTGLRTVCMCRGSVVHLLENDFVDLGGIGVSIRGDSIDQVQLLHGLLPLTDDDFKYLGCIVLQDLNIGGVCASSYGIDLLVGRIDFGEVLGVVRRMVPLRFGQITGLLDVELVEGLVEISLFDNGKTFLEPFWLFLLTALFLLQSFCLALYDCAEMPT